MEILHGWLTTHGLGDAIPSISSWLAVAAKGTIKHEMAEADRHNSPLTFEEARRLRDDDASLSKIGELYGVSRQYVHKLLKKGPSQTAPTARGRQTAPQDVSTAPSTSAVNRLTPRERKFAKGLLAGKTQKTAALEAIPAGSMTPGSAEQWATRTVRKARFQGGLRGILEEAGLTEEALARVHGENLYANKVIGWDNDEEGRSRPIEYPDYRARQRAVDAGWRLYRPEPVPPEPAPRPPIRVTKEQFNMFKVFATEETLLNLVADGRWVIIPDGE